jgi:hypothetical protein
MKIYRLLASILICSLIVFYVPSVIQTVEAAQSAFKAKKRFLYIQPGQTVFSIVKVLYPGQREKWPEIIKKIVKKNPHAFEKKQATRIIVGQRIELPSLKSKVKLVQAVAVYKGPEAVGQVVVSRGKTFSISEKNKRHALDVGSEIFVGDRLFTGVKGYLRLNMIDDAKIDLRCNSEMLIEDYRLMRAGNRSIIYLLKGSLRKVTGTIGKFADDVYEMKTPLSTVGVRGTDYALRVLQAHGCDGSVDVNSNGLFVKVNKGSIDLKNKKNQVALNVGDAMHVAEKDKKPQAIKVGEGVFDAAKVKPKVEEPKEEETSWWWWLLGIVAIAAAV